jgi:flagellar basal body rod protein FlgG
MQVNQTSMLAHANHLFASAHNVANVNTESFGALKTTLNNTVEGNVAASVTPTQNPTSLAREMTDQISVENGFEAQVRSIQTKDAMLGSLLDVRG